MPIVTQEIINSGMSKNGAWSIAQLKALLPEWEFDRPYTWPAKGWRRRIIGTNRPKENIQKFLELKNAHLEKTGSLF